MVIDRLHWWLSRRCRFDSWVGKIRWRRRWQPTPVFLPGKSHGQRILEGYSPWGPEDLDMNQLLSTHLPWSPHFIYLLLHWKASTNEGKGLSGWGVEKREKGFFCSLHHSLSPSEQWRRWNSILVHSLTRMLVMQAVPNHCERWHQHTPLPRLEFHVPHGSSFLHLRSSFLSQPHWSLFLQKAPLF